MMLFRLYPRVFPLSSVENFIGHKFTYKHVALSYLFRPNFFSVFFTSPIPWSRFLSLSLIFYSALAPGIEKFYLAGFIYAREFSLPFAPVQLFFSYLPAIMFCNALKLTNARQTSILPLTIIISYSNLQFTQSAHIQLLKVNFVLKNCFYEFLIVLTLTIPNQFKINNL